MERASIVGWVPVDENEKETLETGDMSKEAIRDRLLACVFNTKKEAKEWAKREWAKRERQFDENFPTEFKKVRVSVTIDVEKM